MFNCLLNVVALHFRFYDVSSLVVVHASPMQQLLDCTLWMWTINCFWF